MPKSIQDLYNDIKSNTSINLISDLETFSNNLKDPEYLSKVEYLISDEGLDINEYDLKKKDEGQLEESSLPSQQDIQPQDQTIDQTLADGTEEPVALTSPTSDVIVPTVNQAPVIDQQKQMPTPEVGVLSENKLQPSGITVEGAVSINSDTPEQLEKTLTGAGISAEISDSVKNPKINLTQDVVDPEKPKKAKEKIQSLKERVRIKKGKKAGIGERVVFHYDPGKNFDFIYAYESGSSTMKKVDKRSKDYEKYTRNYDGKRGTTLYVDFKDQDVFKDAIQLKKEGLKSQDEFADYLNTMAATGVVNPYQPTTDVGDKRKGLYAKTKYFWNKLKSFGDIGIPERTEDISLETGLLYDLNAEDQTNKENVEAQMFFGETDLTTGQKTEKSAPKRSLSEKWNRFESSRSGKSQIDPYSDEAVEFYDDTIDTVKEYEDSKAALQGTIDRYENLLKKEAEYRQKWMDITGGDPSKIGSDEAQEINKQIQLIEKEKGFILPEYNRAKKLVEYGISPQETNLQEAMRFESQDQMKRQYEGMKSAYGDSWTRTVEEVELEIKNLQGEYESIKNDPTKLDRRRDILDQIERNKDAINSIHDDNIRRYAEYERSQGREGVANDILSDYEYYKVKTNNFQPIVINQLYDHEKRRIMELFEVSSALKNQFISLRANDLGNSMNLSMFQKLISGPQKQISDATNRLKELGVIDENGQFNKDANVKPQDVAEVQDLILKINLSNTIISDAQQSTGVTPEGLSELDSLYKKMDASQKIVDAFYRNFSDLESQDAEAKKQRELSKQRMQDDNFLISTYATINQSVESFWTSALSGVGKLASTPQAIYDALGGNERVFDEWDEWAKEINRSLKSDIVTDTEGLNGLQRFLLTVTPVAGDMIRYAGYGLLPGGQGLLAVEFASDGYDIAIENGMDTDSAGQFAITYGVVMQNINRIMPDEELFVDALRPSIKRVIVDAVKNKWSMPELYRNLMSVIPGSLKNNFVKVGLETVEESTEELGSQGLGIVANKIYTEAKFDQSINFNTIAENGILGGESAIFFKLFQKPGKRSTLENQLLYQISKNPSAYLNNLSNMDKESFEEAKRTVENISSLESSLNTIPGYKDMSDSQKSEVLSLIYQAKITEEMAKKDKLGDQDPRIEQAQIFRNEALNIIKQQKDAVQKSETGEVPVQPEAAVSEQMEEGKSQTEPQVSTQEGKEEVSLDEIQSRREAPGKRLFNEPNPETAQISEEYKKEKGITTSQGSNILNVDVDNAMKMADVYDQLQDNPDDPEVRKAYDAMATETADQFKSIADKGYTVELWEGEGEPYANSEEMIKDVRDNKHMYIFSTEQGFGNEPITDQQREQNKLLQDSGFKDKNGNTLLYNDLFRFVHDFFGHTERGNGFGPVGEENAWDVHARMYSPLARRAMTTETRGQNSWVNFGPQMRNEDGTLKKKGDEGYLDPKQREFAPQKMALFPEEFSEIKDVVSKDGETTQEQSENYVNKLTEVKNNNEADYWSVDVPSVEDVKNSTIIENKDGQVIVSPTGDIKALYKNPDSKEKGVADVLLKEAVEKGGITLDNYDNNLSDIYKKNGFRIVSRLPFNENNPPKGWDKDKHGTPDVVGMIYDPENKLDIEEKQFTKDQYLDAMAYRDTYIDAQKEAYPKQEVDVNNKVKEQRKSTADKVRGLKSKGGRAYSAGLGIPVAIWDGAIETIATAIEAGVSMADAIQKAKDYLKRNYGKAYDEKKFAEEVMNISLDKVMEDKAKFVETTKEVANEVESGVIEGKSVDTWIKFSDRIVDKETKRKEKVEVFRGEVNQENVKENAQESYNSTALKLAQYNVFASDDFKNIVKDFSALPAKKQKQLISDYNVLIDKKIASIQKSIGKLDKKDENYKADKAEYENDIKALKEAKKNKSFEDVLTSLDQFSPNTKATIISDIFLNKEIVYNNKGEAVDYKKLNKDQKTKKAEAIYQKAKETVISNLTAVYNSVDPAIRNLSKLWYDGANLISQEFGKQYDLTLEQSAAIIATQSPQMPWFQNLHLAHAIMDIMKNQADTPFSQEMLDLYIKNTKEYADQKAYIPEVKKLVGKKLSELSEYDASIFVRSYYELNMDKRSPIRIPSGTIVGYEDKVASFSGYDTIAKGVSIFRDGSQENISKRLGDANKVRNFYLNIANPNDDRAVTIDTHAMAIALMKPLGSSSYEVNFTPPYFAFYADAYREAAEKLGIKTRELQSITWEAARAIFPADEKTDSKKSEVSAIWDKYNKGEITLEQAQNQILNDGKDPNITEWAEFTGQLLDSKQRTQIFLPIRPSKRTETTTKMGDGTRTSGDVSRVGRGDNGKRTSTKLAEGLRKGAEAARKGKRGGLAMNPIDPFLEVVATALEAGASLTEAIANAIEKFKNSDFYKNLSSSEKSKALNDLTNQINETIAPQIAREINNEMSKGKGLYTATENVKKQMIKDGLIDEKTFDKIVGKAESIVKSDAEMMLDIASNDAADLIKSGKSLDEAQNSINDAINNEIGYYSNQDKSLKKDLSNKTVQKTLKGIASEIAGLANSYKEVDNSTINQAVDKALSEYVANGMSQEVANSIKENVIKEVSGIRERDSKERRKEDRELTVSEKEALKDQIKKLDSEMKKVADNIKREKAEGKLKTMGMRQFIKDYLKNSGLDKKLSSAQMRAIVNRATGLMATLNPNQIKAFVDYVQKIVDKQDFAEKMNDLSKNKRQASKRRHNQYTSDVKFFLSTPLYNSDGTPLMTDKEMSDYMDAVADLSKPIPDHQKMNDMLQVARNAYDAYNEISKDVTEIDFDNQLNAISAMTIDSVESYNSFVRAINTGKRILDSLYNQGKIDEATYESKLKSLYTKEDGLRKYEQVHQDEIDALKDQLISDVKDLVASIESDPDKKLQGDQKTVLEKIITALKSDPKNLRKLDVKDLVKLQEGLERIDSYGFMPEKEMREIANRLDIRSRSIGKAITTQLKSLYNRFKGTAISTKKLERALLTNDAAQIEGVLGLKEGGAIYQSIIQPINSALTKMKKKKEQLIESYYQLQKSLNYGDDVKVQKYDDAGNPIADKTETIDAETYTKTRVAILSSIIDYASKTTRNKENAKDFWGSLLEDKSVKNAYTLDGTLPAVMDIYNKLSSDPRFLTDGKLDYNKIYEAFITDPSSIMNDTEQKLFEGTQKLNKEMGELLINANSIRGVNGELSEFHYPRKMMSGKNSQDADLVTGSGGSVGGLRAGSSYSRTSDIPTGAIDLNLDRVMATQIFETTRDYYLNDAIQYTNEVFRDADRNATEDEKIVLEALKKYNRDRIDFELQASANNLWTKSMRGFSQYALIGLKRTPSEFITNAFAGILKTKSLKGFSPEQNRQAEVLMEKFNSPIQFMGWDTKSYATLNRDGMLDKNAASSVFNNMISALMNISGPLTKGEWKAEFDKKFTELTGEKYSEKLHLESPKYQSILQAASAYANQQIEKIKGGSFKGQGKMRVKYVPDLITDTTNPNKGSADANTTWGQMVNIFNNFVYRDVNNFYIGAKKAVTGREIAGGIKDMLGSSYRLGSYAIITTIMGGVIKSAFGNDEEEKEEGREILSSFQDLNKFMDLLGTSALNLGSTLLTGKYGTTGRAAAMTFLQTAYNNTEDPTQKELLANYLNKLYFQDPINFDKYDAAQKYAYMLGTSFAPQSDVIFDQLQKEFEDIIDEPRFKGATITDIFEEGGKLFSDPEMVEWKKAVSGILVLANLTAMVSGKNIPGAKDVVKLLQDDAKKVDSVNIPSQNGFNLVEGVVDFNNDGQPVVNVNHDFGNIDPNEAKKRNSDMSNDATQMFAKSVEESKDLINSLGDDAFKFAYLQYLYDKSKYDAKVNAGIIPAEEPKNPLENTRDAIKEREKGEKIQKNYQKAKEEGKFSDSKSKKKIAKTQAQYISDNISALESSDNQLYNAYNASNVGGKMAIEKYLSDKFLFEQGQKTFEPYKEQYFYISDGKIVPIQQ